MSRYNSSSQEENSSNYEYEQTYSSHTYSYTSNENEHSFSYKYPPHSDSIDPVFTQQDYDNPNPNYPQPPETKHNPGPDPVQYGGMVSHDDDDEDNFYLHIDPTVDHEKLSDFELSNCEGCINDVQNIKRFLTSLYNFKEEDMVILTDDQEDSKFIPTKANILSAMEWLIHDAEPNDSGHGGRVADTSNDEDDGYDETIYPLDFDKFDGTSGQILDDEMHEIMVKPLPKGCRLTAIFDSCHSGTVLDLPYIYSTKGIIKENNVFKQAGMGFLSAGIKYASGDREGALSSILSLGKEIMESRQVSDEVRERNTSLADVIMFSGCKDDQTSADAKEAGRATGAMSYALTTTLREDPNQSYYKLLNNIRCILRDKYSQRPQLSASHPIDVYLEFKC
ncbi:hypothetical protein G6F43_010447 [Rhizopus delemar]|nr:hypothetical protein G6F43_010447 [Rhizopus delemar]